MTGALDGVRIVDLTTVLMGPLASRMLADHGADVIRVEAPAVDASITGSSASGLRGIMFDIHRNKRSITLDLKSDMGNKAMRELVATADVFVSNMRASALERIGLSPKALRTLRPELIYCIANGFGSDGPYAGRAAYDDVIQAASGLAALETRITGEPRYVPSVVVDKICALHIVQAVMAALLHQRSTGEGQTVEVPMFETMVAFNSIEHLRGAALVPPKGSIGYSRLLNRNRRPYRCADGWVALLPYTPDNWRDFCDLVGRPEILDDDRFVTAQARLDNAEALYGFVSDFAPMFTVTEWLDHCDRLSIPAGPVFDLEELLDDPHVAAVELLSTVEHPVEGTYRSVRNPVLYDSLSTELRRHAPVPGEHTTEVLSELGWTEQSIAEMQFDGGNAKA